jgi:hypothetical protein
MITFLSCATSENLVRQSNVIFPGGSFKERTWNDKLDFRRTSWYISSTLAYDVLIARLDSTSPFSLWLESNQKMVADNCRDFYVMLMYTNTNSLILDLESPSEIRKQMTDIGFEEVSIAAYRSYLAAHPIFSDWHLKNHKIAGFCYKNLSNVPKQIFLSLPGFKSIDIISK